MRNVTENAFGNCFEGDEWGLAVTIFDVAKRAGVSKTTVSAVLCDRYGVKKETKERVLEAIRELNYVPDFNARNFVQQKKNMLGAITVTSDMLFSNYEFHNETGIFSQDIINGIVHGLMNTRYGLLIEQYSPGQKNDPVIIRDNRVDGLFIIGALNLDDPLLEILQSRKVPIVAIGQPSDRFDSVLVNTEQGIFLATEHLIQKGHRRIALVNCSEQYFSNRDRYVGFERAMKQYGVPILPELVANSDANTGEAGYRAAMQLFAQGGCPDAIIGANASVTMGVYRYLYEQGLCVPRDVSLIGQDDCVLYGYHTPAISAIDVRKQETAEQAVQMMLDNVGRNEQGIRQVRISPVLKLRDSVLDHTMNQK